MQTLAGEEEGDDDEVSEEDEENSRQAVIAASQKEGGTMHVDDNYVPLENNPGPRYPPTHNGQDLDVLQYGDFPTDQGSHTSKRLRNQDTIVPVNLVQMSMCVPPAFFFFFTLVTGASRSLNLKLSDTRVYVPPAPP